MSKPKSKRIRRQRAHLRVRRRVRGTGDRPRLAIYKSLRYIYAQVIDDQQGTTLVQASTLEPEVRSRLEGGTKNKAAAKLLGEVVAERAREKGIERVVYDRGGYVYHGRVEAIAAGARDKGLEF